MTSASFDFAPLLAPGLPPAAAKWTGFPRYNFVGGHNDAEHLPVDELTAAATAVLRREGATLATYGLNSGPQGYRPLREFLVAKLKRDAGMSCLSDEILITSGSLQAIDLVNGLLLARGDTVLIEHSQRLWRKPSPAHCRAGGSSQPACGLSLPLLCRSRRLDMLRPR
jgi:2-aminoadipate transaminase